MLRFSLSILIGLCVLSGARAGSWADSLFQETIKDFGLVPRGPSLRHNFVVTNNTGKTVQITGLRVSCGCVVASTKKSIIAPGEQTVIETTMDTTRFRGAKSVKVFVTFSEPRYAEVQLWVRATSRDDVSIVPETLAFGQVKKGTTPSTKATITFRGNQQAQIVQVQCASNYIRPVVQQVSRTRNEVIYALTAKLRADTPAGKWFTDVWLVTNVDNLPRIRVPLTVEVESPLSITPPTITMGEVKLGKTIERKVIVRGVKPFKVVGVRGAGNSVSVIDSTAQSRPVHILTIRLNPTEVGDLNLKLSIVTDLDKSEIDLQTSAKVVK